MQRARYSNEFKIQAVKDAMKTGKHSVVARLYDLNANIGWTG